MSDEMVSLEAFKGRNALCDERFQRDNKRLNKLDDAVEAISAVETKLGVMVERHDQALEKHDERICVLEQKPAKRWESSVATVIALLLGGIVGYIFTSIGMG